MWIVFALGVVALVLVLVGLVVWSQREPDPGSANAWYGTEDAQVWDEKLRDAEEDFGLAGVKGAATAWGASITALLGVFTAVAILKGPESVTSVGGWQSVVAAWVILTSAAIALAAVLLCALAAQGVPVWRDDLNAWTYRNLVRHKARLATAQLEWSRYLIAIVLLLVFIAMGITWLAATSSPDTQKAQRAIVVMQGDIVCGTLYMKNDRISLTVGGASRPVNTAQSVTLVDKCP